MVVDRTTAPVKAGNWARPCRDCGATPSEGAEFGITAVRRGRAYRKPYCKGCACERVARHDKSNPEQARARELRRDRDWTGDGPKRLAKDPDVNKRRNVRASFGIELEDYRQRLVDQGNKCAACDHMIALKPAPEGRRQAVLDHDHTTGALRKFLCDKCNVALGMVDDSPSVLRALAAYLELNSPW